MARSDSQQRRRAEIRDFIRWYKERGTCSVPGCHVSFKGRPWLADFNHVAGEKAHNPADMAVRAYSWDVVFAEICKTTLECANHHRETTHGTLPASTDVPSLEDVKLAWEEWRSEQSG